MWERERKTITNRVRGKQIEFNKNGSPEANYVGRELKKNRERDWEKKKEEVNR